MQDKLEERQAKEKSRRWQQEAGAGGKRRAKPDGGEHQQGGDEQPGNLNRGWEERQGPKEKERRKREYQNGQNYCGFPKWGEERHRRCGGAGRKGEQVTGGAGGCSWSQSPPGSPGKKWSPAGG